LNILIDVSLINLIEVGIGHVLGGNGTFPQVFRQQEAGIPPIDITNLHQNGLIGRSGQQWLIQLDEHAI
jgi:hypothetical protein